MKKLFCSILLTAIALWPAKLFAQMGEPYEMKINGVKVIVQPSGNEIVEVLTIIKGGVQNYAVAKAGIENLAMTALTECGTLKDDKNAFKNKLDKVSAEVGGFTGMDYASFRMNCIAGDFEKVWPLYVDAMTIPRFDAKEFERVKQDQITALRAQESNPDFAIDQMAKQLAFAGKNYSKSPGGTIETVSKLTAAETKNYYKSIFTRSRMVIVVVGELDKKNLEEKLKAFLTNIPQGAPFVQKRETFTAAVNNFQPRDKELATNYVKGITSAPPPGTPDYDAFVLAMRIFARKHFIEVRTNNGLSYAPQAYFSSGLTPYANVSASTTDPNKYIAVTRQLIDKIKTEGFTEEDLRNQKIGYITNVYYRQETNIAQAAALASNEVVNGNWKRANTIKDEMKKVTVDDLNRVFKKYISNFSWAYQGDSKKVNPQLYKQKDTPKLPAEKKAF